MPCGLHASHTETYKKSYKDWGLVSTRRKDKNEAIKRVKELIFRHVHGYVRSFISSCPQECPTQIVVISFSTCTINVHNKPIRRIDYYEWRYEIDCTWKVDVYCLNQNERLVPGGEMEGGSCGLVAEEGGNATGQGMSIINGDFACERAKEDAYLSTFEVINRTADNVQCPKECPKKFISFWFGEPTCTVKYIEEKREWHAEAQQPWKVIIYCLPGDGNLRIAVVEKGGGKETKEKEEKEKKRRKRKVKK